MGLFDELDLEELTPATLWSRLPRETKELAAAAAYAGGAEHASTRREADHAIATAMRFRDSAVRQLPARRRADYLAHNVVADESLSSTLLLALHLSHRVPLLECFLDALEIPQSGGMIDEDYALEPPPPDRLAPAVERAYANFAADEVDLYLASLLAMDPETWDALGALVEQRRRSR